MVRRWSHINGLNNTFFFNASFFFLKKKYKFLNFKSSVSLKRFNKKYTKFKRKALTRLKHINNWNLYHNIFRYWSNDYRFIKKVFRFQYFKNIFLTNYYFYNFTFIQNKNVLLNPWNFLYVNSVKKTIKFFFTAKIVFYKFLTTNLNTLFFESRVPFTSCLSTENVLIENNNYAVSLYNKDNFLLYTPALNLAHIENAEFKLIINIFNRLFFLKTKILSLFYKNTIFFLL